MKKLGNWIKNNYMAFAGGVLVVAVVLIKEIMIGCAPFGDKIYISGDTIGQILPYFEELKNMIKSGESITYSDNVYGGTNFYYCIAYSLASPFTWILGIVPSEMFYSAFDIMVIVKALLVYSSMAFYLCKRESIKRLKTTDIELPMFACVYALSAAFMTRLAYYPFVDTMIFIPLVILGLERFVNNKGWKLYFCSLAMMVWCEFFTGLMGCVFVVLYYFTLNFKNIKVFINKSLKILVMSILGVGVCSIILIPVCYIVMGGAYGISEGHLSLSTFGNWFNILFDFYFANDTEFGLEGNYWDAACYMGVLVPIMAIAYFRCSKIKINVRIRKIIVFAIYILSLNVSLLNYVVHLLHITNGYTNRQVVFILFYFIILAQEAFEYYKDESKSISSLSVLNIASVILILIIVSVMYIDILDKPLCLYGSVLFVVIIGLFLGLKSRFNSRNSFRTTLVTLTLVEIIFNFMYVSSLHCGLVDEKEESTQKIVSMDELKTDGIDRVTFYGYENKNLGLIGDVNTFSGYATNIDRNEITFLRQLGIHCNGNATCLCGSNPFSNAILSIKYIVSNEENNRDDGVATYSTQSLDDFDLCKDYGDAKLYVNNQSINPIFVVENKLDDYNYNVNQINDSANQYLYYAEMNNSLCEGLTGISNLFIAGNPKITGVESQNCESRVLDDNYIAIYGEGEYEEYDSAKKSYAIVEFTADQTGDLYVCADKPVHIGRVEKGKQYSFEIEQESSAFANNGVNVVGLYFAYFNDTAWSQAYEVLKSNQMNITSYSAGNIEGTLTSDTDDRTVFTTIPYDSFWNIYVDGKKVDTESIAGAFLSFTIDSGTHDIKMVYKQKGIVLGVAVSLVCLALAIFMLVYFKKGKYVFWLEKPETFVLVTDESNWSYETRKRWFKRKKKAESESDDKDNDEIDGDREEENAELNDEAMETSTEDEDK